MDYAELHAAISNARRLELLRDYPLLGVLSAPGHGALRNPEAVETMARAIAEGRAATLFAEPILLGVFTAANDQGVAVRAVECLDGHHRLLAGLRARAWRVVGDLPAGAVDTRVNGWRAHGVAAEPRWIPLAAAQRSGLAETAWFAAPEEWGAKGPTAVIPGEVCGLDPVFDAQDRSLSFQELLALVEG